MKELLPEFNTYKHISFDLWLTLIKSDPEFKPKRNQLFRDFFGIDKPIGEVSDVIRKFDILTNNINEKVGRNFNTFEIYYLILDALSVDIDKISSAQLQQYYSLSEDLLMQYKPLLLDDGIPSLLKNLHENGKTMNILSNTAFIKGSSLRRVISNYDLDKYFAFQIYSDETGYSKPSREMYLAAYEEMLKIGYTEKRDVLHVGDNPVSDYDGAIKFGFNAHLLKTPTNESKLQPA